MMLKTIKFNDANLDVWFEYVPPTKGAWEHGVQIEPDYPSEVIVHEIYYEGVEVSPIFDYDSYNNICDLILKEME